MEQQQHLWIVLVPTEMIDSQTKRLRPVRVRQHRVWDSVVRGITGGLTIQPVAKGQWVSPTGKLFAERMIPVQIACTREQIKRILGYTKGFYNQEKVFAYRVSDEVIIF